MRFKILKFFVFFSILYLICLGFYFNFRLADEKVSFIFTNTAPKENAAFRKLVYVSGEVEKPGVYEFKDDMRVAEVIDLAGGFTEAADSEYISKDLNLSERLKDEQKLFIPSSSTLSATESSGNSNGDLVNINTASLSELDALPGIGPSTAQKIIDNRPYSAKEDLLNVSGIGDAKFNEISDLIGI